MRIPDISSVQAKNLSHDALKHAIRVELFSHGLETRKMRRVNLVLGQSEHVARILRPMRSAGELGDEGLSEVMVERLVVPEFVANRGLEAWEVEHDCTFAPVCAIRGVGCDLAKEIKVSLSELDVDAASVRRSHWLSGSCGIVKCFADALEDSVGLSDGEG